MVLDLIVVIMFITTTVRGKIRGFSDSLIRLAGLVAGVVLGVVFTEKLADIIMLTPLDELIRDNVRDMVNGNSFDIIDFIPSSIGKVIRSLGATETEQTVTHFANAVIMVLAFLLIVLATWIVAGLIRGSLSRKRHNKTFIGTVDSSVGLLFGAIKGALLVFLFLALMFPVASIILPDHIHAINESLNNSYIAGYLYDINPLIHFIKKLSL